MRKSRIITMLVALLCALTLCVSAGAEKDVATFLNAAEELLFLTGNVTVSGSANLSLDGTWIKTVTGKYIQAGYNSYLRMDLRTPLEDGLRRGNGYTVIDQNGDVLVSDDPTAKYAFIQTGGRPEAGTEVRVLEQGETSEEDPPAEWRLLYNAPSDTILTNTVVTRQIMNIADYAAEALASLPDDKVSVTEDENGKELKITLGAEDGNGLIDLALNALYQYVGDRYFNVGYDTMDCWGDASIDDYGTVKYGLLYAVRDIALKKAAVRATLDEDGQLKSVYGTVTLTVTERTSRERELTIELAGTVSDRGTSSIAGLIPDSPLWVENVQSFYPDEAQPVTYSTQAWDDGMVRVIRWTHEGEAPETYLLDNGTDVQALMNAYNEMTFGDPVQVSTADAGDVLTFYYEDGTFSTVRFDDRNLVMDGEILESADPLGFWNQLKALCDGLRPVEEEVMPMLPLTEDGILPDVGVTNEKEAVSFAKRVWSLDTVRAEYPEDAVWTAEDLGEGRWRVICAWNAEDGEKTLSLTFAGGGAAIETLENGASGFRKANEAYYDIPEGDNTCRYAFNSTLALFGQRASELLAPGSTDQYRENYWKPLSNFYYGNFYGYLENGDARFADYYCEKVYGDGNTRGRFIIQYLPEVRVVFFSTKVPLEEGGNG